MVIIRNADYKNEKTQILNVINRSFLTVAKDFNLTKENSPTNPAFIDLDHLDHSVENNLVFFVAQEEEYIVGCVGIQPSKNPDEYYIERLSVLPEYRHNKIGNQLLDKALEEIRKLDIPTIGIGIVNENIVLKKWYSHYGFIEKGTKKFEHLPFTVCFMELKLGQVNVNKEFFV